MVWTDQRCDDRANRTVRVQEPYHLAEKQRDEAALLERFAELIEASNHNLLSARGLLDLRSRHIPECKAFAELLPRGVGRVIDIGSGGGLPGLVIAAIRPDIDLHLVEGTRKKARFLQETSDALELSVMVHNERAEDLAHGPLAASFDVVTARAVAPLHRLLDWTLPFLAPGGMVYAIKGARWEEELADAVPALHRHAAHVVATPADRVEAEHPAPNVVVIARST